MREMLGGARGFNELQRGLAGISRSVLTDRMRSLERAEIIERRTGPKGRTLEYRLTRAGRDLEAVVQAMGEWGYLVFHRSPPRGARPRPPGRLDGPTRRSRAASLGSHHRPVRLSRSGEALLDGARALGGLGLPPASRVRRRPKVRVDTATLYRATLGASSWAAHAGAQADAERPEGAPARLRALVRLERVRPGQPPGRRAPEGRVATRKPREGAGRTAAAAVSSFEGMSGRRMATPLLRIAGRLSRSQELLRSSRRGCA